jgi:peptidoglycan hydrolase-like protein with peptidoglycan-binding domain
MISRKAILPTLLLSLVAGLGVSADAAQTQSAKKKPITSSSGTHRGTKKKSTKRSSKQRGQKAPTADRISAIQTALAKDGSYSGEPTGKWDDSTVAAMKKYQAAHGLNPSGKLDALTLQKLGLGGTTAGVAAPLPPIGSTSRLTSGNSSSISATRQQ